MSGLQASPDNPKDLEKDERGAMEVARCHQLACKRKAWLAAKDYFEARLQRVERVEAERDRIAALRMSNEDRDVLLAEHPQEISRLESRLTIALQALEDATEGLKDMIPYVPEYFQEKWDHPGYVERAERVLVRLRAKQGEGTMDH